VWMYYKRYIHYQEQELDAYKKQQKQKVEEMKQKMKYYVAKNLIDRYEQTEQRKKQQPSTPKQPQVIPQGIAPVMMKPASHQQQIGPRQTPLSGVQTPVLIHRPVELRQEPYVRTWVDRVLDMIVGEEAETAKYALVCEKCFAHNGLALPEEIENLQYTCPKCGHFNGKRRRFTQHSLTPVPGSPPAERPSTPDAIVEETGPVSPTVDDKRQADEGAVIGTSSEANATKVRQRMSQTETDT
jgi:endoplasmic reticulum junction formation protein lunapark